MLNDTSALWKGLPFCRENLFLPEIFLSIKPSTLPGHQTMTVMSGYHLPVRLEEAIGCSIKTKSMAGTVRVRVDEGVKAGMSL